MSLQQVSAASDTHRRLMCSIDYGTKTLTFGHRIETPGKAFSVQDIQHVSFSTKGCVAPQKAAWDKNGDFYWGHSVAAALKRNVIEPEDVIELWKLLLYKDLEDSALAHRVRSQLGKRSLRDLITEHLRAILAFARDSIKDQLVSRSHTVLKEIDDMPIVLLVSVPQMWSLPANDVMAVATKAAGADYAQLVYEPQCAAASLIHQIRNQIHPPEVGEVLLVADIGGGTGDFVSYRVADKDSGAKVQLTHVGKARGALCGSELVNIEFEAWLQKEARKDFPKLKTFEGVCKHLGHSTIACLKQATASFEQIKLDFDPQDADTRAVAGSVCVRGPQGGLQRWEKDITNQDMVGFFRPVLNNIFYCIDAQIMPDTTTIALPGGFGRSDYLRTELQKRYSRLHVLPQLTSDSDTFTLVSQGALLRYESIVSRGLASDISFGIGLTEVYDPKQHPDATHEVGDVRRDGKICTRREPDMTIVEKDPYNNKQMSVYERWNTIMTKNENATPGKVAVGIHWQQHYVHEHDTTISVQVYWTELDIPEHGPMLDGKTIEDGKIKDGIEPWREPLVKRLPDLKQQGYPIVETPRGDCFEFFSRLVLTADGANVSVKWELAPPYSQPFDEDGKRDGADPEEMADVEMFELCDEAYNPVPRVTPS